MTRLNWISLAVSFLVFYGIARMVDLDLGYFGAALLIAAGAFFVAAAISPRAREANNG